MQSTRTKGINAEIQAAEYLQENGFHLVAMNYSIKANRHGGEIDIIAKRGGRIHFVEVKCRTTDAFGLGRESVNAHKQKTIRRIATWWLVEKNLYDIAPTSFDVIEITGNNIEYFENCF